MCQYEFSQKSKSIFSFNKMSEQEEVDLALLVLLILRRRRRKKKNKKRSVWVKEIFRHRKAKGAYHHLIQELRLTDRESHFR